MGALVFRGFHLFAHLSARKFFLSAGAQLFTSPIDRICKWQPINYSFVYVLIKPTSLVLKEYFFCILPVLMC